MEKKNYIVRKNQILREVLKSNGSKSIISLLVTIIKYWYGGSFLQKQVTGERL